MGAYPCNNDQYPVLTSTADGARNCASCDSACDKCTGPSRTTECDACNSPYYKDFYARECVYNTTSNGNNWHYCKRDQYNENPGSHGSLAPSARLCKPCDPRCSECFGPLDTNCNNCHTPTAGVYAGIVFYKWLHFRSISLAESYICSAQCPPQEQYPRGDNTCGPCHAYCYICTGPSNLECSSCYSSIPAYLHLSSQCLLACPTGYYSSNASYLCYLCPAGCTSCTASTALTCLESTCIATVFCSSCGAGYTLVQAQCQILAQCREYAVDSGAALWSAASCSCSHSYYFSAYLSCSMCHRQCLSCTDAQANTCASCYDGASLAAGTCTYNGTFSSEISTAFFGTFGSMPSGWWTNASSPYNGGCGYGTILMSYGTGQLDAVVRYSNSALGTGHYALTVVFTMFFFDEWPDNGSVLVYHNRDGNTKTFVYDTRGVLGENLCGYNFEDFKFRFDVTFEHIWNDVTLYFKTNNQLLASSTGQNYYWGLKDVAIRKLNCFGNCTTCYGPEHDNCDSCTGTGVVLQDNKCVCNTGGGYFKRLSTSACSTSCEANRYRSPETGYCMAVPCPHPNKWGAPTTGNCVALCPASYYAEDSNWLCVNNCYSGYGHYAMPEDQRCYPVCPNGWFGYSGNGQCVEKCPATWYGSGTVCVQNCPSPTYADASSNLCLGTCSAGYFKDTSVAASPVCLQLCPSSYFGDPTTFTCGTGCSAPYYADSVTRLCSLICTQYQATSLQYAKDTGRLCTTNCGGGLFGNPLTGKCVSAGSQCSTGYFADAATNLCTLLCSASKFSDPTTRTCVGTCPSGWYGYSTNRACL